MTVRLNSLVAIAVAVAMGLLVIGGAEGRAAGGPLKATGIGMVGIPTEVGHRFSLSFAVGTAGRTPATIERVRLVHHDPAIRVLGVRVVPMAGIGFVSGFPPSNPTAGGGRVAIGRPAVGASVPTGDFRHGTATVVLGLLSRSRGVHVVSGVEIDYHVGVRRFRTRVDEVTARFCVPKRVYAATACLPPP